MSIDPLIHSLEAQLRDCRELLNQTNQELAVLAEDRNRMSQCAEELAIQLEGMINFASGLEMDLYGEAKEVDEDALAALTNYRSAKQ